MVPQLNDQCLEETERESHKDPREEGNENMAQRMELLSQAKISRRCEKQEGASQDSSWSVCRVGVMADTFNGARV